MINRDIQSKSVNLPPDDCGKYIFVSYSHKDGKEVLPIIAELQKAGYTVWYDEGIDPGTEYNKIIADHIINCDYFVAAISKNYIKSSYCVDEVLLARNRGKICLRVHIEETALPSDLELRLGGFQAVFKYTYSEESNFYAKLFNAEGINICKKSAERTDILQNTFSDQDLKDFKIENGVLVKYLGKSKKVTIPNGVTEIGKSPFNSYSDFQIKELHIPGSVTSISFSAFSFGCSKLTKITVAPDNPVYDSRNDCNAIIEKATGTLVFGCKNTIIPRSITSIGNHAFSCCGFKKIFIPRNITKIGVGAFSNCGSLSKIVVESGNPVYCSKGGCNAVIETKTNTLIAGCKKTVIPYGVTFIYYAAFEGCSRLKKINIPKSVKQIGNGAFYNCCALKTISIPEGVEEIDFSTFTECTNLKKITIPSSVTKISLHAFWNCDKISNIIISPNNPVYDSREGCNAIIETATNTLLKGCKNTIIPNTVTVIGEDAFCYCEKLKMIAIPNSVRRIEKNAFNYCDDLKYVVLKQGVQSIGERAFYSCHRLKTVFIPESVTCIAEKAFFCCLNLKDVFYCGTKEQWLKIFDDDIHNTDAIFNRNTLIHVDFHGFSR